MKKILFKKKARVLERKEEGKTFSSDLDDDGHRRRREPDHGQGEKEDTRRNANSVVLVGYVALRWRKRGRKGEEEVETVSVKEKMKKQE